MVFDDGYTHVLVMVMAFIVTIEDCCRDGSYWFASLVAPCNGWLIVHDGVIVTAVCGIKWFD